MPKVNGVGYGVKLIIAGIEIEKGWLEYSLDKSQALALTDELDELGIQYGISKGKYMGNDIVGPFLNNITKEALRTEP